MHKTSIQIGIAALLILAASLFLGYQTWEARATGYIGLPVTQSVATTTTVGPDTVIELFAANKLCTARAIGLSDGSGTGIRFITADPGNGDLASTSLTGVVGLSQSGSTTVTYPSGENGCGRWFGFASASTTVTLVEYQ